MAAPIGPVRLYRSKYGRPTAPPVAPPSTSPAPVRYYKPKYASPLAPRVPPPPSLPQTPEEALASRTWGETAVDTGIRAARQAGGLAQAGLSIFGAPEELAAPEPVGTSPGEILASGARSGLETASGIGIPRIARAANAALGSGLDALGEYASPGRRRADELFAQIDAEEKAALPATEASAPVPASSGRWGAHQGEGYDPAAVSRAAQRAEQEAKLTFRKIGADPAGMVGDIAGNALPFMAAGRLGRVAGISEEAMAPLFSVPLEAGSVKQNIAQTVMDEPHENLMSDPKYASEVEVFGKEVARKRLADRAQSYLENPGLIALGAAEGYILSKLGADAALMRAGSGAVKRGLTRGVLKNTLVQGAKETATEIPQEMFTTAAGNIGAASGGANIDPMRGVVESGIMAGATAGPAGAAAGGVDAFKAARAARAGQGQEPSGGEQALAEDEFTQTARGDTPPRVDWTPQAPGEVEAAIGGAPIAPPRRAEPAFDQTAAQIVLEAEILGGDGLKALMDTGMSKARAQNELKRVRAVLGPKAPPAKGVDRAEDKKAAKLREQVATASEPSPADEIASFDADPLANRPRPREGTPEELAAYLESAQRGISTAEDEATLAGQMERARSEAQRNLENQAYAKLLAQPTAEETAIRSEAQRNLEEQWVRERADQLAVAEAGGPAFYVPKLIAKAVAQDSIKPLADAGYPASPSQLRKMLDRAKASAAEGFVVPRIQAEEPGSAVAAPGTPEGAPSVARLPVFGEARGIAERVNPVGRPEETLPAVEAGPQVERPARVVAEDGGDRGKVHAESVRPDRGPLYDQQWQSDEGAKKGDYLNLVPLTDDARKKTEEILSSFKDGDRILDLEGTVWTKRGRFFKTPDGDFVEANSLDGINLVARSAILPSKEDGGRPNVPRDTSQAEPEPKEPNLTNLDRETQALYDEIAGRIEQIQSAEPNATHAIIAQRVNKEFGTDSRLGRGREALSRRIVDEILTGRGPRRAVPGTKKEDVPVRMAQSVNLEKDFDATMDRIEGEAARRSETGIAFDAAERMLRERFGPLEAEPDPEADLAAQLEESVRNTRGKGIQGKPAVAVSDQAGISEIPSALGGAEDRSGPVSEEGGGDARDVSEPARGTRDLVADEAPKTVEAHAESVPPKTKETKYEFSSTQVDMPPPLAADIKAVAAGIADEDLAGDGREVDPHATVKFGLHTNDEAEVRKVLEGEGPIKVTFGEISTFPPSKSSDGAAVVKIDLDSPDLHRLNKKIAGALEVTDTFPTYKPHVTLAYVKPESAAAYVGRPHALSGRTITLDSVTFSAKDGREIVIPLTGKPQEAETVPVERPKPEPKGDFEGFTASMTPLQKGQARAALAKDGRAGKIEAAVAAGSSVRVSKLADMPESKRLRAELERLQKPSRPLDSNDDSRIKEIRSALDGIGPQKNVRTLPLTLGSARIYTDEALGKTALDYAEFLIAKRDGKAEPTATGPEVKATRGRALVNEKAREQTKANLERLMTGRGRLYVGPQSRVMVDGKEVLVPTASIMKELGATMDPKDFNYWIPAKAANAATEAAEVTQVEAKPTSPEKAAAKVEAQIERVVDMKGAKSAKEVHDRILKALEAELVAAEKDSPFKEITYRPGGTANGKPAGTVLVDGEAVATVHSGELKWNESRGEAERRIGVDKHDAFGRNETQTTVAPVARLAIARELSKDAGSIKLQIPGDGTFTISRNPEAIRATIDRIKKGGAAPWKSVASYKAEAKADAKKQGPLFSRKPSAEEPRDLILQHNLTAANLIHADKMGGLAVPSMAVGKVDMPLEGFGEITLLGNKSMADPSESGMQVFSGDIYSPRYPTIRYKIRKASVIDEALKESNKAIGYSDWQDEAKKGGIDALSSSNPNVVWTFLRSKGIEPDVRLAGPSPERMAELRKVPGLEAFFGKPTYQNQEDPEFRRLALEELKARHSGLDEEERRIIRYEKLTDDQKRNVTRHLAYELEDAGTNKVDRGKSRDSLRDQLQALGLEREFETFRRDLFERAGSDSKIFKGFTNAGNERTIPHTLENVVAEMKRNMKAGEGFSYGPGTVRGAVAPRLKSLQEIRNAKDRIVSKEAMAAVKEEVNTTFWEAAGHLPTGEGFGAGDRAVNFMVDVSRMGFPRAEREYGWKLSEADRKAVGDFMTMLQTVPTEYFEAKLQRAVGIGEFSAAVVPNDADPKAVAILESHGIKIERYDRSDPADRKRAISDATEGEGMRFSRRPGESAPFFSQLERAAETVKQPMKGSDMLRFLSTREGVKASELKWTGLDDFLRKKGEARVTPEEVREFLKANKVTVTEVTRGEKGTLDEIEAAKRKYQQLSDLTEKLGNDEVFDRASIDEFHRVRDSRDEARRQYERLRGEGTNFSQYQLPGGSNYREVLLTLPGSGENERLAQRWFKKTFTSLSVSERQFVEREAKTDPPRGEFRSSHFDEPNILAHVRFNERTSADGKRVLFLEEIQSDWAQKGRKEGFKGENQAKAAERDALLKKETLTEAEQARLRAVRLEIDNDRTTKPNAVPAAPFVEKTEDWTALAMKAILQKAATEGYDSVAWTTGDMQAERYDLSKQLTHVTIVPNEPGGKEFVWWTETNAGRQMGSLRTASDGTILKAHSDYGDVVGKNVSDVFGKDLAEKGLSVTKETRLSGLDLKVGGEGMKAFYDRIVPQVAEKIGKKWGAKIGMIQIPGGRMKAGNDPFTHSFLTKVEAPKGQQYFIVNDKTGEQLGPYATSAERQAAMDALEGPRVHSIPITPEMRASVTSEGFPLFQRAGETTEADWEHYNGRQDADRAESSKTAYRDGVQVNGAAPGVRVVDFEGDVDKSVLNEMARSSASLAARIAPAVRMIQAHVPDLKFGGFAPAGNLHGVQVSGMVFVNQLATHQIAVAMAEEQGITYHEAFAKALTDVLVHEAAHYSERGHGDAFQAELDRIMEALGPVALKAIRRDFMKYASDNKNRAQNARMYEKALPGWREGERRGREAAARVQARSGGLRTSPDVAERLYPRPRSDTGDAEGDSGEGAGSQGSLFAPDRDATEGVAAPAFVRGTDGRVDEDRERNLSNFLKGSVIRSPMYHATGSDFSVFDVSDVLGAHFGTHQAAVDRARSNGALTVDVQVEKSPDTGFWEVWVEGDLNSELPTKKEADALAKKLSRRDPVAAYLSLKNPLRVDDLGTWGMGGVLANLVNNDHLSSAESDAIWTEWQKSDSAGWNKLRETLESHGNDGFVYRNEVEDIGSDSYIVFHPEQIKSATGNRGTFDPKNPDIRFSRKPPAPPERLSIAAEGVLNDLAKRIRDVFTPVKVAQEAVEKKLGKRWNVRLDRQLTGIPARADHTMGQAESLFLNPLMEVVRTKGLDFDLAGEYAQAVYDEEMPQEKRDSIMEKAKGKRTDYEEVRKRILDVQRISDDYKVRMGLATPEEIADLRAERGADYVSTREHPLIAAIQDLEKTVIQAERNRSINDLAEFIEAAGEPKLGTVSEGFEKGGVHFRRNGALMTINLPDKGLRAAMDGLSDTQLDNLTQTVGALTRWTSRVNTQLSPVFPIRNTGRDWGGAILFGSILHGAPKGISKSVAWEVMKNEFKAMRGVIDYLKAPEKKHPEGSWAAKVAEASRYGAVPGYLKQMSSIGKIRSQLEESLKSKLSAREHLKVNVAEARTALGDRSLDSLGKTAKIASLGADAVSRAAGFRAFSDFMGWLSNVSEMATRANYHTALVKNGMNPRVAADETRDLIDFNRKGSWTRNMQAFLPFINPNIQGTARILDMVTSKDPAVKARALKTITALTAAGFAYGMAMAALGGDEDKYGIPDMDQLPDYQSSRNVILPAVGNLSPILLPLPPGFNVPFFAGFMASKLARGTVDPGKAIASIAAQFAEAFTPVDSPFGVFKPLSEIATNKKFGGGPVSPTNYSEHRPDSTLAFKNTRTPYRVAAEGLNRLTGGDEVTKGAIDVSPDTLEHLGEALLGGTGRFFTRSADSVEALAKGQVPNYIPVYSDLTVDVERHRQARFYDQVRQIEEIDFKRRGKEKSALVKELAERYPGVDFTRGTLPQLRKALQGQGVSPERREWFLKEMERIDGAALRAKPLFDDAEKALKNIEKTMKDGPEKDAARREVYLRANRAYQEALK